MSIDKVYSNGNFVYAIGGIPVGSGSVTPPPPPPPQSSEKTLWLATDNAAGVISGSAYINGTGSPVAVWSSTGSSASASVTLWPGDTVVVVSETNRPVGYSSTIYSTGYTTSAPWFTTAQTVVVSGTATYEGADSAIMSAKYSAGEFVVTGDQVFASAYAWNPSALNSSWPGPIYSSLGIYGALRVYNEMASSSPASSMAYRLASGKPEPWFNSLYEDRRFEVNVSAFKSLYVSAEAAVRVTATSVGMVEAELRQDVNFSHPTWVAMWHTSYGTYTASEWRYFNLEMSGTAMTGLSYYGTPYVYIEGYSGASAEAWLWRAYYSGVLK